jgi:hypothetical protein
VDEAQAFLEDEFDATVSYDTIRRAIQTVNVTRKVVSQNI